MSKATGLGPAYCNALSHIDRASVEQHVFLQKRVAKALDGTKEYQPVQKMGCLCLLLLTDQVQKNQAR